MFTKNCHYKTNLNNLFKCMASTITLMDAKYAFEIRQPYPVINDTVIFIFAYSMKWSILSTYTVQLYKKQ